MITISTGRLISKKGTYVTPVHTLHKAKNSPKNEKKMRLVYSIIRYIFYTNLNSKRFSKDQLINVKLLFEVVDDYYSVMVCGCDHFCYLYFLLQTLAFSQLTNDHSSYPQVQRHQMLQDLLEIIPVGKKHPKTILHHKQIFSMITNTHIERNFVSKRIVICFFKFNNN